jgi:prefoldin subunit 5
MDGAIDIRLIVTLGGILFSVAGAAAVGKMQIKVIQDTLNDIEARLRKIDQRIDTLENGEGVVKQRLDILAQMNSPENLRRDHMELAQIKSDIAYLKAESDRMHKLHNGVHPPVAATRTAK